MNSPFPGMDPFIEACHLWEDFHSNLIGEIQRVLSEALPARYVVRAGERGYVVIEPPNGEARKHGFWSDVSVGAPSGIPPATISAPPTAPVPVPEGDAAPISMQALTETEYREVFLEIRLAAPDKRLVTCIELLSPSNKRPRTKGWRLYNRKRAAYLAGQANFVEIDLLRGGTRMPMASAWPNSPYYVLVCREREAPTCKVWPAHYRRPLLPIPIPLMSPDPDLSLSLQPLIEIVYARSRYERDIDYRQPLDPALAPADAAWLEERLVT
jgi:hypothetical protein